MSDALVLVADDGSGRVWVVEDGSGKAWFRPGEDAKWLPVVANGPAVLPDAEDLAANFAEHDPKWNADAAAMLEEAKGLSP